MDHWNEIIKAEQKKTKNKQTLYIFSFSQWNDEWKKSRKKYQRKYGIVKYWKVGWK